MKTLAGENPDMDMKEEGDLLLFSSPTNKRFYVRCLLCRKVAQDDGQGSIPMKVRDHLLICVACADKRDAENKQSS